MSIELWGPDADGMLSLMESPDPDAPPPVPAPARTPTPAPAPAAEPTPAQGPGHAVEPLPADELRSLRRMIEAQRAEGAQRDVQVQTIERLVRGEDLTPPPDAKPAVLVEPKAEHFDDHESYVRAAARFEAKQEVEADRASRSKEEQATRARAQMIERDQSVKQAEDAFVADHPDYVDVVTQGLVAKAPPEFRQLLMLLDEAPAVAYHVAQDEALLRRLLAMPPGPLFYALGRLSASAGTAGSATSREAPPSPEASVRLPGGVVPSTLSSAGGGGSPRTPPPVTSGAPAGRPKPAPPRPLGGSGAGVPGGFREDMEQKDYVQWRRSMAS